MPRPNAGQSAPVFITRVSMRVMTVLVPGWFALISCTSVHAEPPPLADEPLTDDSTVLVAPMSEQQRRAELRRALLGGDEVLQIKGERRRLTQEERVLLHRELREAVRGAYDARFVPADGKH